MKDIKSLYLTAKSSGKESDINAYIESIQELINDNPNGYISQLEYIISSDIGLKTVKPFIEKNGFPIACYDYMIECLNECIRKCEVYNKDASIYIEAIEEFKEFRSNYLNCFMMFENFRDEIKDNYVKTYYGKNKNGHQNRKLVAGMINTFGEAAIPDLLITAESIDSNTVKTVLEFISNKYNDKYETIYEWVLTACEDISYDESCYEIINHFEENCLSTKVDNIRNKENQLIRESLIMDNNDLIMEYSEDDIKNIQELIMFKEYQMTWIDENNINQQLNDIYDLYEMLDAIIDEYDNIEYQTEAASGIIIPILFVAGVTIAGIISIKKDEKKYRKRILSDISKITGKTVTSAEEYLTQAKKYFKNILVENKKEIEKSFYKYEILNDYDKLDENPTVNFTYNIYQNKTTGDKLLLSTNDIVTGLIKESELKSIIDKFNSFDSIIKFGFEFYENLPADDSGGNWYMYKDANICEGGPEDYPGKDNSGHNYERWIDKQYNSIERSGYNVYRIYLYTDAEEFIKNNFTESLLTVNTSNKKTGEAPTYLSRNHDLSYGEKDPSKNKYDNSDDEASEDEFRRPSASKDDSNSASPLILPSAYNNSDNDNNDSKDDNKDNDSVDKSTSLSSQDKQIINNYYYNYHNSLNRNTNSYNKDNSSRDNHSRIDNSVRDNHSKTDNSTTTNINSYNLKDNIDDIDNVLFDKDEEKKESCEIWKLDPITEAIGDADFNKPESDHPIKDIFTDIDRKTVETQQKVKKKIQDANNVGRSVMKPINRSKAWINKMVMDWKDSNETNIKEKMADPRARKNIFSAIRTAIAAGSYVKAGILLNPVFLFLGVTQKFVKDKNTVRIRNEMIAEIKTEIEILNEKIEDAKGVHDNEEKYKMIRIRNELNKKLIRVGGTKAMSKMI